jgi:DNA-binding transcriptional ArsR family regulator
MLSKQTPEHQQPIFAALADPVRRSLLVHLAEGSPKTATQLAQEYPITRQGILKHLTILEAAGLVAVHQAGREKRYTLTPEPLGELEQWIKDISATWDARLLRLKIWLEQEQANTEKGGV